MVHNRLYYGNGACAAVDSRRDYMKRNDLFLGIIGIVMIMAWVIFLFAAFFPFLG